MSRKKHHFLLKIDPEAVEIKYGFTLSSNLLDDSSDKQRRTELSDLPCSSDQENRVFSFLDESKQSHSCIVTMASLLLEDVLPSQTKISCFWCRHGFKTRPIGCPVSYVPCKLTKSYHSEITKDKYRITDNVSNLRANLISKLLQNLDSEFQISRDHDEYYVVDGIFCSFNCCMAFIRDSRHNSLYDESEQMLYSMYNKMFENPAVVISPSPNWRLLRIYGGILTIDEFRQSFESIEYLDLNDFTYQIPATRLVGRLYEKKVKF